MRRSITVAVFAGLVLAISTTAQAQDWSTIKGQVVLKNSPKPEKIDVTNDKAHCLAKGPLLSTLYSVNAKNDGFRNVVVWLRIDDRSKDNRKASFPVEKIKPALAKVAPVVHVIDQPCCQFEPRVVAARTGDKLVVKNSAPVGHNIKMDGTGDLSFNVNLPAGGKHEVGVGSVGEFSPISYACTVHPWMNGRLRIFDHPYFAVTDNDGKFEIKDAPVGKWSLVVWHQEGFHKGTPGSYGTSIEVKGAVTEIPAVEFEFVKPKP